MASPGGARRCRTCASTLMPVNFALGMTTRGAIHENSSTIRNTRSTSFLLRQWGSWVLSSTVAEKIPQVAPRVPEDADAAVGLVPGRADHLAARAHDAGQRAVEVFDAKEQPNAAGELTADQVRLILTIGAGEYEPGAAVGRSYYHPPRGAPVGRRRRGVLREDEAKWAGEELDGGVVLVDDQGHELERHRQILGRRDAAVEPADHSGRAVQPSPDTGDATQAVGWLTSMGGGTPPRIHRRSETTVTDVPLPEAAAAPTTKERVAWMGKNSKRLIIALIAIIVAALVVIFSFSLFSSSSANPGNLVSSGVMTLDNSADGTAILTAAGLLPGESGTGTVTIENVGESTGTFTLTTSNLVNTPPDPALSAVMTLAITDETATSVYSGPLADNTVVDLGSWTAGQSHTYTFTVTFASTAGNEYQGAQTTLDFVWSAGQSA
jgi:hypothetical protein